MLSRNITVFCLLLLLFLPAEGEADRSERPEHVRPTRAGHPPIVDSAEHAVVERTAAPVPRQMLAQNTPNQIGQESRVDETQSGRSELTAAIMHSWLPYFEVDRYGTPYGFGVDVLDEVAALAGIRVKYLVVDTPKETIQAIKEKRAQVMPSMGISPAREAVFTFTPPVETFGIFAYVRAETVDIRGPQDFTGHRVGVVQPNIAARLLKNRLNIELVTYDDVRSALFDLLAARIDVFVYPKPVVEWMAREIGIEDRIKAVGESLIEVKRGIAIRKDETALAVALSLAVNRFVESPRYQEIYAKWFGRPMPFWTAARVLWGMGGVLAVSVLLMAYWRYRAVKKSNTILTKEISERIRAEADLAREELLLRTVLDSIPSRIVVRDTEGRRVLANKAQAQVAGTSEAEFLTLPDQFPNLAAAEISELEAQNREVLRTGKPIDFEQFRQRPDGHEEHVRITKVPLSTPQGIVEGVVIITQDLTQRKKAEQELASSQRQLQIVFDTIPHTLIVKDQYSRYIKVNKAWCDFYGLSPDDVLGKTAMEIPGKLEEEKVSVMTEDQEVLEGENATLVSEHARVDKNGRKRHMENIRTRILDDTGNVVGLVAVALDITDRKRAEEELRQSEERFRILVEHATEAITMLDVDTGLYVDVNPMAEALHGIPRDELIGKTGPANLSPKIQLDGRPSSEAAPDYLNRALAGEFPKFEWMHLNSDGIETLCEVSLARLPDPRRNLVRASISDITERKKAEEELQSSQRLLQAVFDTIPIQVFVKDATSKYLMANHEYMRRYGTDIVGSNTLELPYGTEEEKQEFLREDQHILETGVPLDIPVLPVTLHDGSIAYFHSTKYPLRNQEQQIIGIVGSAVDITELVVAEKQRESIEAQLRHAQKMEAIGILAAGVAHDFNNMLQIIHGYGNIALTRKDANLVKNDIHKILKASESAAALTSQLLTFSRKQPLQATDVELDGLIGNLMRMMGRILGEDIELKIIPGIGDGLVHGDPGMIEQVLMNLCVNARDAMPKGGRIAVETRVFAADEAFCSRNDWAEPGNYAVIEVSDDGSGIPADQVDRIFEPFYTTKEVGKGTGLGLAVVYGIIEQHKGHIVVYSENGIGTTFKIYLPLSGNGQPKSEEVKTSQPIGGMETILIAEDQQDVLELAVSILEDHGYTVLTAADGEEALGKFEENASAVDLVLLDVVMPKMSGSDAYGHMRKVNPSLRALFSTGYSSHVLDSNLIEGQELTCIQKPYSPTVLLSAVREVLEAG